MKISKKLKLILQILICILIILIGIVGVYEKRGNMYKNIFPHTYTLGSDINGITIIEFRPDDSIETTYYDKDGKEVDSSTITEKNEKDYEKKEIPVNAEESLNLSNYEISLKIMEDRLNLLDADQYKLDLDEENGIITLRVEDDYLQDIESILPMQGSLKLIDSISEEVIIDYTDFKSAESTYASLTKEYRTYINFKLNDSGLEKINNIDKYKTAQTNDKGEQEVSSIIIMFDTDKVAEISYDDILLSGKTLRLTTGSGLTSDADINSQINLDTMASKLATIGRMPVVYSLTAEEFVKTDIGNIINYILIALIALSAACSVFLIFKYKVKGLLAVLGFVTNISIFLIIIRITKIQISLNSFAGMFGLIILNNILLNNLLKCIKNKDKVFSENIKDAYLKTLDVIVIMLIILIVLAFSGMTVINTVGLVLFWGWVITVFGNLIFTVPMLSKAKNK